MILSGMFSSCSAMFQGGTQIILGTSFTAKEEDIIGADNDYKALEAALRNKSIISSVLIADMTSTGMTLMKSTTILMSWRRI